MTDQMSTIPSAHAAWPRVRALLDRAVVAKSADEFLALEGEDAQASGALLSQIWMARNNALTTNRALVNVPSIVAMLEDPERAVLGTEEFNRTSTVPILACALLLIDNVLLALQEHAPLMLQVSSLHDQETVIESICSRAVAQVEDVYAGSEIAVTDLRARFSEVMTTFASAYVSHAYFEGENPSPTILLGAARGMLGAASDVLAIGTALLERAASLDAGSLPNAIAA